MVIHALFFLPRLVCYNKNSVRVYLYHSCLFKNFKAWPREIFYFKAVEWVLGCSLTELGRAGLAGLSRALGVSVHYLGLS